MAFCETTQFSFDKAKQTNFWNKVLVLIPLIFHRILGQRVPCCKRLSVRKQWGWSPPSVSLFFGSYLANIPGLDVLQFNQELLIIACLELLYKYPAVSRLLVQKDDKMFGQAEYMYPYVASQNSMQHPAQTLWYTVKFPLNSQYWANTMTNNIFTHVPCD